MAFTLLQGFGALVSGFSFGFSGLEFRGQSQSVNFQKKSHQVEALKSGSAIAFRLGGVQSRM